MTPTELEVEEAPAASPPATKSTGDRVERLTVIRPAPRWPHLDIAELWHYRELLYFLVWRDIKVRYKQTVARRRVGGPPAVPDDGRVQLVFGRLGEVPVGRRSVPDLLVLGAAAVDVLRVRGRAHRARASSRTRSLVTKVYFPRLLIPLAAVPCRSSTSCIAFVVLLGLMAWYGVVPTGRDGLRCRCFLLLGAASTALGVGLWLVGAERPLPRRAATSSRSSSRSGCS